MNLNMVKPETYISIPVTYPGCLGDRYTGLGAQTLTPKKQLLSFLLSDVLQQKYDEMNRNQ